MSGKLIEDRIKQVFELVAEAAKKSGRSLQDITVLGATKKQSIEHLRGYVYAGFNHFGESYVQEALEKQKALSEFNIDWHFIGSLQSKKCKQVIGRFQLIHSVDRKNLIKELAKRCQAQQCQQQILLQVNIGEEDSKSGCDPEELPGLIEFVQKQEGLILAGLMTMPPQTDSLKSAAKWFSQLRELQNKYQSLVDCKEHSFQHLSMGTSGDFLAAIEEGATIVRLGTVLLGERPR